VINVLPKLSFVHLIVSIFLLVVKQKAFAPLAMPFGEALAGESGVGEVKVEVGGG
jgi:hypothetical protein